MKRLLTNLRDFLLFLAGPMVVVGAVIIPSNAPNATGYLPTAKRIWAQITDPGSNVRCQNSLKQMALAIHASAPVQPIPEVKESK